MKAYSALAIALTSRRRRDLVAPLASARSTLEILTINIAAAERAGNAKAAHRLRLAYERERAVLYTELAGVVDTIIADEGDAVLAALGEDTRSLAEMLEEEG